MMPHTAVRSPARSLLLPLLLLALASCRGGAESGIDRTFVRGTVSIPPGTIAETEGAQGDNDTLLLAQDLGFLATRYTSVEGSCLLFDATGGGSTPAGDEDYFVFTPLQSGDITVELRYDDAAPTEDDTAPTEATRYFVGVYDLADLDKKGNPAPLLEGNSQGTYGAFSAPVSVVAGNTYAVRVSGLRSTAGDGTPYQLLLSGFDPNGTVASAGASLEVGWTEQDGEIYTNLPTRFLVGAYAGQAIDTRGLPLGGSDVPTFTLDTETLTWSGDFEITYVYAATLPEAADTGGAGVVAPEISLETREVALFAGSFPSLNAGVTSGTIYSTQPTVINLDDAVAEELPAGWIGVASENRVLEGVEVICDTLQPKQYGWAEQDTEPNDFADAGDGYTVPDPSGAQVLPVATGAGFVDTITGTLDFAIDNPEWTDAPDAFALTVPESLDAYISVSWPDASYNLDVNFYDSTGALIAAGWNVADSNPEAFGTVSDYGFTLEPGETYYLALFGWSGAAGSVDYSVEIEWLAP